MKLAIASMLLASASAFTPSQKVASSSALAGVPFDRPSAALPFAENGCPATLDGSLPGDVGFDPVGFSTTPMASFFDSKTGAQNSMSDLKWLREAEITHGRIAQLAVVGFLWPSYFGTFPGNEWTGEDAYSYVNPIEELEHVPGEAVAQLVLVFSLIEFRRVSLIRKQGPDRLPGDLQLGQGPGPRFNPFGLNYTPEEFFEKQTQEIKHCRLAMLGAFGLFCQCANSGVDIKTQIGGALTMPEYTAKAGYFLPEGI
jgi:light-harvesting complex I chlorophyll a/b binding protein 1